MNDGRQEANNSTPDTALSKDLDKLWEDRFWVKSYLPGVPDSIDEQLAVIPSMGEMFRNESLKYADRKGFVSLGTEVTYGDMLADVEAFAAYLQSVGVKKGDRVAIMMPNCLQYPVALFGVLLAGGVVVNVNPLYTPKELIHQLEDSGAVAIVFMEMFGATLEAALKQVDLEHIIQTSMGDMLGGIKGMAMTAATRYVQRMVPAFSLPHSRRWKAVMKEARKLEFRPVDVGHDDIAFLQYTGGTTGVAKGAVLTHRNVVANTLQGRAIIEEQLGRLGPDQLTNVTLLPLYHIYSLTANLLLFTGIGGRNILIANPRDVKMVQFILRKENFDGFCGLNTLFMNFLENKDFCNRDFSNLKFVLSGGMAMQREVADLWEEVTGVPVVEGYGLTECSPFVSVGHVDVHNPKNMKFTGRVGFPVPSTEVRMRRDDGSWSDIGEPGELCVRGPQVMRGYWKRPEETQKVIDEDGWLATGDMGVMFETGEIQIVDRIKDMILVSGFNVYPTEIEDVIAKHPHVVEVAVIGVPDPAYGEKVKAIVVPRDPSLTEQDIIEHCRQSLTGYKVPRVVEFRLEELPKSNVGKVLRRELR